MYCEFYQLTERPFNVTPDPKFLYLNARYREAIASLSYGITQRKGFITLIGEAGTGKTTLLKRLLEDLDPKTKTVFIFNTNVTFEEILEYIFAEFDLPVHNGKKLYMLQRLNTFLLDELRAGGNVALLIDEAQDLEFSVLEDLRLLSNLETAKEKILQIVLSGQPELGQKLSNPVLRQLRQRISINCRLLPLSRDEVSEYVQYRLQAAGSPDLKLFTREAEDQIYHFSRGVPRLINVVCDNALVIGYALGKKRIGADIIKEAAADLLPLEAEQQPPDQTPSMAAAPVTPSRPDRLWKGRAAVIGLVLLGLIGGSLSILRTTADSSSERGEIAGASHLQVIQPGSQAGVAEAPRVQQAIEAADAPWAHQVEKPAEEIPATVLKLRDPREEARRYRIDELRESAPVELDAAVPAAIDPPLDAVDAPLPDSFSVAESVIEEEPPVGRTGDAEERQRPVGSFAVPGTAGEVATRENEVAALPTEAKDVSRKVPVAPQTSEPSRPALAALPVTAPLAEAATRTEVEASRARRGAPEPQVVYEQPHSLTSVDVGDLQAAAIDVAPAGGTINPRLDNVRFARVRVQEGDSISAIAARRYGQANATILDLVKLANPNLHDIDLIVVGQTIRLPQLDGEFPVLDEGGEQYSLLVSSTGDVRRANHLRDQLRSRGYEAQVVGGELGPGKPLRRVVVSGFRSREQAVEVGKRLQRLFREDGGIAESGRTSG